MLVTIEEEVESRRSKGPTHSSRREEVLDNRFEKSSHFHREEEVVGIFISPRDKGSVVKETQNSMISSPPSFLVEPTEIPSDYWRVFMTPTTSTIDFPIESLGTGAPTNLIPLTTLPSFHGMASEDHDTFLFEFDIVCQGYDYITDA